MTDRSLAERLRDAVDLLESIASDRRVLLGVPEEDMHRLLRVAGEVSRPDAIKRRQLVKQTKRNRKAEKVNREEALLADTGIRKLRREVVFTTPNVFPPRDFEQHDVDADPEFREVLEPQC